MFRRRNSLRSSEKSWSNFSASGAASDVETVESEKFILSSLSKSALLYSCLACSGIVLLIAGMIRSSVVLSNTSDRLDKLQIAGTKLGTFQALETMANFLYAESYARVKYLSTGYTASYYPEVTQTVSDINSFFEDKSKLFKQIYFNAAGYHNYNCSVFGIRSNLINRPEAVPLNQYRNLDERNLNAFDDADYYQCLMVQVADILGQQVAGAPGIGHLWNEATAYFLAVRSIVNLQAVVDFAHLTRELVLKKGSVNFARNIDATSIDDSLAMAQSMLQYADEMTPESVGTMGGVAIQNLAYFLEQFTVITNATKALLLVSPEKFDLSTAAKATMASLITVKEEYRVSMVAQHNDEVAINYLAVVSESVKMFIFMILLLPLAARCVVHMKNESIRLKWRYESSVNRYDDSCKAIYRLLPEPVAKKLSEGVVVRPEFYHSATVFYSDIVGFTTICSRLTAIEVLSMLNTIYSTFDSRTNAFKCYKIETIGDAYIVASGLPTRTTTHASEIASLALALVEEVGMIKVPHSSQFIRVRIGISSGPVIAGIVGIKMLRYCLFGKTVLLANRMEQTSQPQKIHLSFSSYLELQKHGGFLTHQRPKEEWPDENPSFWLIGKTTTSAPLSMFSSPNGQVGRTEVILV